MVWAKIDDGFLDNVKLLRAGPLGRLMHVHGIIWSCRNLTDGFIPFELSESLVQWGGVLVVDPPGEGEEEAEEDECGTVLGGRFSGMWVIRSKLEANGLWEPDEARGGWLIHDFLKYNPSRSEVLKERSLLHDKRAAAGRIGGRSSGVTRSKQARSKPASKPASKHKANTKQTRSPEPVPDPLKNSLSSREIKKASESEEDVSGVRLTPLPERLTQQLMDMFETRKQDRGGTVLVDADPDRLWGLYRTSRLGSGRPVADLLQDWSGWLMRWVENEKASRRGSGGPRNRFQASEAPQPSPRVWTRQELAEDPNDVPMPDGLAGAIGRIGT